MVISMPCTTGWGVSSRTSCVRAVRGLGYACKTAYLTKCHHAPPAAGEAALFGASMALMNAGFGIAVVTQAVILAAWYAWIAAQTSWRNYGRACAHGLKVITWREAVRLQPSLYLRGAPLQSLRIGTTASECEGCPAPVQYGGLCPGNSRLYFPET